MSPVVIGNATRIYSLCEFPGLEPRYVGKTVQPLRLRLARHLLDSRRPRLPVHYWLSKRSREGRQVCINWLETVAPGEDWAARERHWIAKYRSTDCRLLNLTDGGEGLAGYVMPIAHKKKIAAALNTRTPHNCLHCGNDFNRKANEVRKGHAKFCSRQCANTYNRGGHRDAT